MDPCVKRPANGWACSEIFGRDFALKHGRLPSRREVLNSDVGRNFSPRHENALVKHAREVASETLIWEDKNSVAEKKFLESEVKNASGFMSRHGITLVVEKSTTHRGRWVLAAKVNGSMVRSSTLSGLLNGIEAKLQSNQPIQLKLAS